MVDGHVLDAYLDGAEMVLWVKADTGRALPFRAAFTPAFHVAGPDAELDLLARTLPMVPGVGTPTYEKRLLGLSDEEARVLKVPVSDPRRLMQVARLVDKRGDHRDLQLYDVDLRMGQRFFLERGLFPFARVKAPSVARIQVLDDPWSMEYALPPLRESTLAARCRTGKILPQPEDPVVAVEVDGDVLEGPEADVLRETAALVARKDPDVIYTRGGDRWMLRHLETRARALGLVGWTLGREAGTRATRKAKSYHSYGKVKHRSAAVLLPGRIHVDLDESFFFAETSLAGVADLCRLSGIPMSELARLEAGTAVTAIQVGQAKREGRLVPWKKSVPEHPKTLRTLVKADRGGHLFDPAVGLHEDVVELDFASMYPSIISRHNLGAETILCPCCAPEDLPPEAIVPQVGYHVCRRPALVPGVLGKLVARREEYKRRRKTDPARRAEYQGMVDALKWLNVVSFGYQGYRNARFGCIEAHEATTAWGREILLTAAEVARDHGYEILHGIVDSLWLRKTGPSASPVEALARDVEAAVGIRFEPQGRYDWIVFLPTRGHRAPGAPAIGATNRFYGRFDKEPEAPSRSQAGQKVDKVAGGVLKVRGVEMRQSSTPRVVVEAQERMLEVLARARDAASFRAAIPLALAEAARVARRLRAGGCAKDELLVTMRVGRELERYEHAGHVHAALRQLKARGVRVAPGERVRFVITDAASRDPEKRVREARLWTDGTRYDPAAYETLLVRAAASLLLPLGYDEARVGEIVRGGPRQAALA